ncbi:MAG: hypothetical protein GX589_09320 [Deltaproteobacteria bacterium]|nr:hypothetical protein [Deltaproteobacteria bacterium]
MASKASEKIIDALTQLMEGFNELQEKAQADYATEEDEDAAETELEVGSEIDATVVSEMRAALEAVIDTEDVTPEEVAAAISCLTEALEEIDPDVFEISEEEESEEDDSIYDGEEDEDYYEDDDLDIDMDDDEEDDEEDEEDDDEDDDDDDDM